MRWAHSNLSLSAAFSNRLTFSHPLAVPSSLPLLRRSSAAQCVTASPLAHFQAPERPNLRSIASCHSSAPTAIALPARHPLATPPSSVPQALFICTMCHSLSPCPPPCPQMTRISHNSPCTAVTSHTPHPPCRLSVPIPSLRRSSAVQCLAASPLAYPQARK